MTVKELITELLNCPMEAPIALDIHDGNEGYSHSDDAKFDIDNETYHHNGKIIGEVIIRAFD